jgi:hypothetical protein
VIRQKFEQVMLGGCVRSRSRRVQVGMCEECVVCVSRAREKRGEES